MDLFVPGRICLFGEHTDWAGGYRRVNGALPKGFTLIAGTNQGIHARVEAHPTLLSLRSTLPDGHAVGPFECPMERNALLAEAEKGGFFSYAAGVAYQVLTHYRVRGLAIDNFQTDLPVGKGLASSAAICVLLARAFNRIYDLKMTARGEMEYAYNGEITTPSRCGRMDQGCAYGNRPIMMVFDGDRIDVNEMTVGKELHFVIVDLGAGKDTRTILTRLHRCYPFAQDDVARGAQNYLGNISARITLEACEALRRGDAPRLGELMREAQAGFDRYCVPACPEQLTAPLLHKLLEHPAAQPLIFGGKGVGSQGDGAAQLIARDADSQDRLVAVIREELGMNSLKLTLRPSQRVRKAVIPAAGFGTRLFPASKAVKKELFPIIDKDGRAKPAMMAIVEEALRSGIEDVAVVVQAEDRRIFEDFFYTPVSPENYNKLPRESQEYSNYVLELGRHVTLIAQETQEGFGHAVYCAREWVGDEPFLLMLGDHISVSETEESCSRQMLGTYERYGQSVVGLKVTPAAEIHNFGCATGQWKEPERVLSVTEIVEKPNLECAARQLRVMGLPDDQYLTVFGLYVLSPGIFAALEDSIRKNLRERGEFQLTSCLDRLRQEEGLLGLIIKGRRFDIGRPDAYRVAVAEYHNG